MSNLTPINGGKSTEDNTENGPKKQLYTIELRNFSDSTVEVIEAFGWLSYGHAFVSVIEDQNTPLVMVPYERILAIKTEHVL